MFEKTSKENKNYFVIDKTDDEFAKANIKARTLSISACCAFFPAVFIWIFSEIKSLLWVYGIMEANAVYLLCFVCAFIGLLVCAIMSFYAYSLKREVLERSAPTLGFGRTSYNGILISAILITALFVYHVVLFVGYHVAVGNGKIAEIIAQNSFTDKSLVGKTADFDLSGLIVGILFGISATLEWLYYFFTFAFNKNAQLVVMNEPKVKKKRQPPKYNPFGITSQEREECKSEFEDVTEEDEEQENKK